MEMKIIFLILFLIISVLILYKLRKLSKMMSRNIAENLKERQEKLVSLGRSMKLLEETVQRQELKTKNGESQVGNHDMD